jgi:DNA-binding NtrC family response regulator
LRPWDVAAGGCHPAAQELPDDIPLLVQHFVQQFTCCLHKTMDTVASDTMQGLTRYAWQDNPSRARRL